MYCDIFCTFLYYRVLLFVHYAALQQYMMLFQNIRDLTPLTHEVISRQATINIGL